MVLKPGKNNSTTNESIFNDSLDGGNFSTKALNMTEQTMDDRLNKYIKSKVKKLLKAA